ncbi:hypothetical protein [Coleofasciculus sp. E1-EBD-02]|uniref:hypothetical protein n=1 Tax=Coleofasciculus sp. E1-EBD-02 TaxID=3068481 RepID=UPI0032F45E65
MSYSDFTLEYLENDFNLIIQERVELFDSVEPVLPSPLLSETLEENIPLALEINTEKARSEMIVTPILIEVRRKCNRQISLFSGTDFNVDKDRGLNGRCDFILSHSSKQLEVTAPVVTLVEAKNDNIKSGIPQCIAEMVAAQIFNEHKNNEIACIYGVITTGSIWKFLKLVKTTVSIERGEHYLNNLDLILGIFSQMIQTTRPRSLPLEL